MWNVADTLRLIQVEEHHIRALRIVSNEVKCIIHGRQDRLVIFIIHRGSIAIILHDESEARSLAKQCLVVAILIKYMQDVRVLVHGELGAIVDRSPGLAAGARRARTVGAEGAAAGNAGVTLLSEHGTIRVIIIVIAVVLFIPALLPDVQALEQIIQFCDNLN